MVKKPNHPEKKFAYGPAVLSQQDGIGDSVYKQKVTVGGTKYSAVTKECMGTGII